ncbi:MAG: hypothetical protein V8R46_02105 [Eubacterium ramulus]
MAPDRIRMRVWERGSGETCACGTGACASVAAAYVNGLCTRKVTVSLEGENCRFTGVRRILIFI